MKRLKILFLNLIHRMCKKNSNSGEYYVYELSEKCGDD